MSHPVKIQSAMTLAFPGALSSRDYVKKQINLFFHEPLQGILGVLNIFPGISYLASEILSGYAGHSGLSLFVIE